MQFIRPFSVLLSVLASLALAGAAYAADLATLVGNLASGGLSEREAAITALAASGDERAVPILENQRGAPDHSGTPLVSVTGPIEPADRSRDHGASVNCNAFDRELVEGAGGSRNHSWALNTSPAKRGLPTAVGRVAR